MIKLTTILKEIQIKSYYPIVLKKLEDEEWGIIIKNHYASDNLESSENYGKYKFFNWYIDIEEPFIVIEVPEDNGAGSGAWYMNDKELDKNAEEAEENFEDTEEILSEYSTKIEGWKFYILKDRVIIQ